MGVSLVTKFQPLVDEQFWNESKSSLITNKDYDWTGAHTVKVYKIDTAPMNDYGREGPNDGNWSRYGQVQGLDATTEEFTLKRDRSFTFAIDKLDEDETLKQLQAADALARQQRQVCIPEIDTYVYGVMCAGAGHEVDAAEILPTGSEANKSIYELIIDGTAALDNAEVPEEDRVLIVTPDTYLVMKRCRDITMETDIGTDMRVRGVIAMIDGMKVIKVPANRVPKEFGFMIAHPCATVAPVKLEDYVIHSNPPGINGSLVEGRICYDAFVLDNKAAAIYYQTKVNK